MKDYYKLPADHPNVGRMRPELTYAWGGAGLLTRTAIGVCGSRRASDLGLEYAYELGKLAAEFELVVVSGYAGGVDQRAHLGALEAGGATIAVLAEGMEHFALRVSLRDHVTASNFLAVSTYDPDAIWTNWRAMQRNKTIISLVDAMFVVEAADKGGTLAAGLDALNLRRPLYVLDFKDDRPTTRGNTLLIQKGARVISNRRQLKDALSRASSGELQTKYVLL